MHEAAERSYPTPLSNSTLLPLLLLSLARQKHTPRTTTTIKFEYDYIVVGAGGAGCVVAARLSEIPPVNVLLLEAGHEPPILTEVPAFTGSFWKTDVDWKFHTVPQKYTGSALVNRQLTWTAGKMLGGSGNLNSMVYVRGNHKNYDDWAMHGAKGWNYSEVLPYFLKLEDNRDGRFLMDGYHAVGGPITVESPRYQPEIKRAVYEAATDMCYKFVDPNAATQTGFYDLQAFIRDNQRCSSLKAYLVPAENRPNLNIVANARVTKVLIQDGRAYGVEFDYEGARYEVHTRKEVIVSAGTVNTPKLLMLSGIGPREELQKFKIPVLSDLPVGKNLHDHGGSGLYFTVNPQIRPFNEKLTDTDNVLQFISTRSGPLASTIGVLDIAFLRGLEVHPDVDFPNYELSITEMPISWIRGSLRPEVYNQFAKPYENETILRCGVQQLQPKSRGTLTLSSANPYDNPVIDPNYLQDPRDLEDIVQGLKVCKKLINSEPFKNLGARAFDTLMPGCEMVAEFEDEYFRCFARSVLYTTYHFTGTSKMGDPADVTTVLDPNLKYIIGTVAPISMNPFVFCWARFRCSDTRVCLWSDYNVATITVKNIKGLRVVDGSVMPEITSGNTFIPIVMIAEKGSDMIKQSMYDIDQELE